MKLLKKALLVGLAGLVLTACGSNENEEVASNNASNANTEVLEDGVLDLGTSADFPPYEYYDDNNNIVGIDAEITKAIGEKMGTEVKIHDMDFSTIISSIEAGKMDGGIAGITRTPEREENVNFSDTYAKSVQKVIVKEDAGYEKPQDLEGKKIATQLGSTGESAAQEAYGEENVQSFNKNMDAIVALNNDKVDAVVLDVQAAEKFAEANDGLKVLEENLADDEYAMALDKNNDKLLEEVNKAIAELKEDGTLDEIINKYMED